MARKEPDLRFSICDHFVTMSDLSDKSDPSDKSDQLWAFVPSWYRRNNSNRKSKIINHKSVCAFVVVLACTLATGGCKDKQKEQALAEAQEAQASLVKVRADLAKTKRELADLKVELTAVKEDRDALQAQVKQLTEERGGALAEALKTQETVKSLAAQSSQQALSVGSLQNEIKQLRALVESQQAIVTEKQAIIDDLQKTIEQLHAAMGERITGPGGSPESNGPAPP
jgi:septal ring factor EnvC (AmiA/AmiB activator)